MNQDTNAGPEISVILASPDNYATIATTMSYLRAQTIRRRIEVVIAAPSVQQLGYDFMHDTDFFDIQVVEVGKFESLARARAIGIQQATAPVVAIAEDHSYPSPTWAEALVQAHQKPWAAVGPVIANANPASATSWAQLYLTYGQWVAPHNGGIVEDLPGHNSSYKRALLMDYGPELEKMLEVETILHQDLRAKGHQLFLDPTAVTHHINVTRLTSLIKDHRDSHRIFSADRSHGWSLGQRIIAAVKSLLMIPLHIWRAIRMARRSKARHSPLPTLLPMFVFGSVLHGYGDFLGFLFGHNSGKEHFWEHEFHRERHIAKSDWDRIAPCEVAAVSGKIVTGSENAVTA